MKREMERTRVRLGKGNQESNGHSLVAAHKARYKTSGFLRDPVSYKEKSSPYICFKHKVFKHF